MDDNRVVPTSLLKLVNKASKGHGFNQVISEDEIERPEPDHLHIVTPKLTQTQNKKTFVQCEIFASTIGSFHPEVYKLDIDLSSFRALPEYQAVAS